MIGYCNKRSREIDSSWGHEMDGREHMARCNLAGRMDGCVMYHGTWHMDGRYNTVSLGICTEYVLQS